MGIQLKKAAPLGWMTWQGENKWGVVKQVLHKHNQAEVFSLCMGVGTFMVNGRWNSTDTSAEEVGARCSNNSHTCDLSNNRIAGYCNIVLTTGSDHSNITERNSCLK